MAYSATILAESSLVAYWKLDETSGITAVDSKSALSGTYTGSYTLNQAPYSSSQQTKSTLFNGTGYVTVPTVAALHPTAALSMEAWIKVTGAVGSYRVILNAGYSAQSPPYDDYLLIVNNDNTLAAYLGTGGTRNYCPGNFTPIIGTWYHVVLTYDGSTARFYVNGALTGSASFAGPLNNTSQPVQIGRTQRGGFSGDYFAGNISDVAFYNTALSASAVLAHYNVIANASSNARLTQEVVEVLDRGAPNVRVTQVVAEVLDKSSPPNVRATQAVAEVLRSTAQIQGVVKSLAAVRGLVQSATGGTVDTYDITARAVTWDRVQAISSGILLGRSSVGSGDVEQITVGAGLILTGGILSSTITAYTDEQAQDATAALLAAGTHVGITFTYNDAANSLSATVTTSGLTTEDVDDRVAALLVPGTGIDLVYDDVANTLTITNTGGLGLQNTSTVDLTYSPPVTRRAGDPAIVTADVRHHMSIDEDALGLILKGDVDIPGATMLYGTDVSGTKGWYSQPTGGGGYTDEQAQDAAAAMILSGTHVGIIFNYDDTANTLSATVTGGLSGTIGD